MVWDIIRSLDKDLFEIFVIGFQDGSARHYYEELGVKKVFVVKNDRKLNFLQNLRSIFLENKIQLVNPHHFGPLLYTYLAVMLTGIKIVYTEHSVWQYNEMSPIKRLMCHYLLWRVSAIVAISNQLRIFYSKKHFLAKAKVHTIINGIDLSRYKRNNDHSAKERLGISSENFLIGMIANLRPEKRHETLISAFELFNKVVENSHLVLVGLDCMSGAVQSYAAKTSCAHRIHFLGSRKDVPDILNALDVFCLSSMHEGLPLTLLEAMACGVPVVGANVLGINEVIADNETGLLFEANNRAMLVDKLLMIAQDSSLRKKLQSSAYEYVSKNYNLPDKIIAYERLFINICGGNKHIVHLVENNFR